MHSGGRFHREKDARFAVTDVVKALSTWEPEKGTVFQRSLPYLIELLETEFVATYLPVRTIGGWSCASGGARLRNGEIAAYADDLRAALNRLLASAPRYLRFESLPTHERNCVSSLRERLSDEQWAHAVQSVVSVLGYTNEYHDMRVLCFHRETLLGWCGAYQSEPFTARQKLALQRVVPTLQRQAHWEKKLDYGKLFESGFVAALQAITQPAYLVDSAARVVAVNAEGQRCLESHRQTKQHDLCECVRFAASQNDDAGSAAFGRFALVPLVALGVPKHYLLLERAVGPGVGQIVANAERRWSLTKRQGAILRHLVDGKSNKEIAEAEHCSLRAVEHHVSVILRKTGLESRAKLLANLVSSM